MSAAGRIMSMKNSSDTIGVRNRDHLACSVLPQPLRHRMHLLCRYRFKFLIESYNNLMYFNELIPQSRSQVYIKYSLQLVTCHEITFVPILKK